MVVFTDTPVPEHRCPKCQELLEVVSSFAGERPSPGAISICAYCGQVLIITEGLGSRKATPEEIEEQRACNPEFRLMEASLASLRKQNKAGGN